jgi:hypothetical protein
MLRLENASLQVDLLDPADPSDAERQGSRYGWGGYIWQVHDAQRGPLLAGPEYPRPDPTGFNGQGLPESFRHRTRDGSPLTWAGDTGLGIGIGILATAGKNPALVREPCAWTVLRHPGQLVFQTRQAAAGLACELVRKVELVGRAIHSFNELTNVGDHPLVLQWFAHPFWALTGNRAQIRLPAGTTVADNPGFAVAADGVLTFRRPFITKEDSQFALLSLPRDQVLALTVDHPKVSRVTFETNFVPDECPVWANAHTISVEPYLNLRLAPGETRHWQLKHGFEV